MPPRASASTEDIQSPTVSDTVRRNARPLLLVTALIGVATFAALSLIAPHDQSEAARAAVANTASTYLPTKKIELSALAGIAALMFGLTWVITMAALRGTPARTSASSAAAATKRAEPVLVEVVAEPLIRDMLEDEGAYLPPTAEMSISTPASEAISEPPRREAASEDPTFAEIDKLAARLKSQRPPGGGHRTLITSEAAAVVPFQEALELSKALAESGVQTILIDWSPSGDGFSRTVGLDNGAGWNDLLSGGARFDDIIQRLPGTRAQAIASGEALHGVHSTIDADLLNLALDALDEVYDHIVVTGRYDEARNLFECIEGRFDAGIMVASSGESRRPSNNASAFLGFEVADIDILRYQRREPAASPVMAQRIALATRPREPVAQGA